MSATSSMPVLTVAPAHPRPVAIQPMSLEDIPAVMAIERVSFPRPWPERAYRYELSENPNAYFVVARIPRSPQPATPASTSANSLLQWISGRLRVGLRPGVHESAGEHTPHGSRSSVVVGFAGMWMYVDEAHIATIATHPEFRGRGIGELILIDLLHEARRRAANTVTLEVRVSNAVAQNLYRKYGFEQVGLRRGYYQDNREDALLMTVTNFDTASYRAHLAELEQNLKTERVQTIDHG